jgi:predicted permease
LAFLFSAVYRNWAYWAPPGIVYDLSVEPMIGETSLHYFGRVLIRPIYFSVVTMTTLGFGDMYANKGSIAGHVLLILQVILGYVLLGALVTRFAVLFTAGGPAGKFAEGKKKQSLDKHP